MRLRFLAVLAAAGLFIVPALAEKPKAANAPQTVQQPRWLVPPAKPCAVTSPPQTTWPSPFYRGCAPLSFAAEPVFPLPRELARQEEATKHQKSGERQVVRSYAVGDLVLPPTEKNKTREKELIRKIITTVEPASWTNCGGEGTIEYFPLGLALVVNQKPDVQVAIERFLDELRKYQYQQVATEVLLIRVSEEWFEKSTLSKELALREAAAKQRTKRGLLVNSDTRRRLLDSIQEDSSANVTCTSPKITAFSGQPAHVKVGQAERFTTGFTVKSVNGNVIYMPTTEDHDMRIELTVEPTILDNGINMSVSTLVREHGVLPVPMTPLTTMVPPVPEKGKCSEAAPFTQFIQEPKIVTRTVADTVVIPDGGSAIFYGGKATVEQTLIAQASLPAGLFAKDRKVSTTNHLLVVVTTHVVKPDSDVKQCADCCPTDGKLGELLADYKQACGQGKVEEARRLAIECLAIDPTCFGKK